MFVACTVSHKEYIFASHHKQCLYFIDYDKCPKISYTKVSDKSLYAHNVDPDQTAPEGAV